MKPLTPTKPCVRFSGVINHPVLEVLLKTFWEQTCLEESVEDVANNRRNS